MSHRETLNDHLREGQRFNRRTLVVSILVCLLSLLLFARLAYLQIHEHHLYTTLSDQNKLELAPIPPSRGLIFDRNGILLADNIPVHSLDITLNRIDDLQDTISELQKIIPIDNDSIEAFHKQAKQHRPSEPVSIRLKLTENEIANFSVNQHRFPGVSVGAHLIRHYPFGQGMSHVLGYVGRINELELDQIDSRNYRATNFIGKIGIEKFFESTLHGEVGHEQIETDARGRTVRTIERTPPVPGNNLYLTIDSQLMIAGQQALGNNKGSIVAIDPNNGEVLALVSSPGYDPNLFVQGISHKDYQKLYRSPDQPLYNRAIRGQYPLGSTIKPFFAIEALDSNIVSPSYRIWDPGWFKLPNSTHLYRDWAKIHGGHGWVNLKRALIVSCDTYFYQLGTLLGISRMNNILKKFGFGSLTGIEMAEELPGLVPNPKWKRSHKGLPWYPGDTVISAIGQGFLLTTPLQLASGAAVLAARGKHYQPHLLLYKQSTTNDKPIYPRIPERLPVQLQDDSTWDFVIEAMRDVVVSPEGTAGYRFGHPEYSVGAKTGTAQVFTVKQNQIAKALQIPQHLRDHSLFIVFAPIEMPEIALAVIVENSTLAANTARRVLDYYFESKERALLGLPILDFLYTIRTNTK